MSEAHWPTGFFHDRFWQRLCLQFLGAGNWKRALQNSGLPENVQSTIRDVVEQTKLLRFEKSEITTELIHHFQDGHERGHSYDELVRDFGTTEVAVSLFRSSKLRSRPMSVKAFRGSLMVFGGGIVGYLLLQLFFHSAKPNPTVDYGVKLNELATSAPVEQQAWPIYRDLWIKHGLSEGGGESFKEIYVEEEDNYRRLVGPSDESWNIAVAKLDTIQDLLDTWREASQLPHLGTPLHVDRSKYSDEDLKALFPGKTREDLAKEKTNWAEQMRVEPISDEANRLLNEAPFSVLLPHIQQFREAARLLHVDTRLAVVQGDSDRALQNIKAIHGLARQAADQPSAVCTLVGRALHGIGFGVIEEVVIDHPNFLSDKQLEDLQMYVADLELTDSLNIEAERNGTLDMVQRIWSDDGNGDGRMTAVGMEVQYVFANMTETIPGQNDRPWLEKPMVRSITGPVSLFTAPSRKEMELLVEEAFAELEARIQKPMWEDSDSSFEEYLNEKDDSGMLAGLFMSMQQVKAASEVKIAIQDAVVLALACHRYKRANGDWPKGLDKLSGKWIKKTPIDRLNGKPLNFVIKNDAPVVYSLGHDGDDDGGVNTTDIPWLDHEGDGDWVIWPQADRE